MALVNQTGKVTTTMGLRDPRPPLCTKCRERKDQLYTLDPNGQIVCADCSGNTYRGVLSSEDDSEHDVGPSEPDTD